MTQVTADVPVGEEPVRDPDGGRVLRAVAALVAVASAAAHAVAFVMALAGSTAAPAHLLALAAMGTACLPCALHLLLLPRRRTWVLMGAVSAAMLVLHPLVAGGHGAHGTAPVVAAAMTVLAAAGLALALAALALGGRARRAGR